MPLSLKFVGSDFDSNLEFQSFNSVFFGPSVIPVAHKKINRALNREPLELQRSLRMNHGVFN